MDFDILAHVEEALAEAFDSTLDEVDGHDFGSGTGNIFIHTNDPISAFELTRKVLDFTAYPTLRAAYRSFEEDEFTLIWPESSEEEFKVM